MASVGRDPGQRGRLGYALALAWVILGGGVYALQIMDRLLELA